MVQFKTVPEEVSFGREKVQVCAWFVRSGTGWGMGL